MLLRLILFIFLPETAVHLLCKQRYRGFLGVFILEVQKFLQEFKPFFVFRHEDSSTVYKTVDFVKTEAFNRTKKNVEQKRYNIHQ